MWPCARKWTSPARDLPCRGTRKSCRSADAVFRDGRCRRGRPAPARQSLCDPYRGRRRLSCASCRAGAGSAEVANRARNAPGPGATIAVRAEMLPQPGSGAVSAGISRCFMLCRRICAISWTSRLARHRPAALTMRPKTSLRRMSASATTPPNSR